MCNKEESKLRILAVDDEEGMREGIKRVLEKKNFIVDTAENGEEAIKLLRDKTYDIALIDLKMPGIDGFQVTEYINEEIGNKTVVVIVSALATVEAAVEVARHGAFDFLVKPFTPTDLIEVTERAAKQSLLIKEREKYLYELNNEKNLSRQLINSMQEGVVVLNINKKPVLMNPKAEYYLKKHYTENLTVEELFNDKRVLEAIDEIIRENKTTTRIINTNLDNTDDKMIQFRIETLIIDGEHGGIIIILNDITDEWKAERDKNRFVSMVAHELKSPMAAIINYINVIQTGIYDNQIDKIHEILERCKVRGEALLELVRDLLYINKREAGKIERTIEELDLKEVIAAQLDFFKVQAEKRGIQLKLEAEDTTDYRVKADRQDLDRIFMNLISNGIKYNRDNGSLTVRLSRENKSIKIEIADTGIGMTKEEMKNLFKEFYRVKNEKTSGISGTGLGLATVKRVLSEYNGHISVDSTPDVGTTFTVLFPSAQIPNTKG